MQCVQVISAVSCDQAVSVHTFIHTYTHITYGHAYAHADMEERQEKTAVWRDKQTIAQSLTNLKRIVEPHAGELAQLHRQALRTLEPRCLGRRRLHVQAACGVVRQQACAQHRCLDVS